jgi:ribosomal-protein-alanine N-acetyltransferase
VVALLETGSRLAVDVRPWGEADAEALAAMYAAARAAVALELPWSTSDFLTPAGQRARIRRCHEDPGAEGFVITVAGAIAGHLSLAGIGRDVLGSAEIGYWIAPWCRGRGVATEALRRATRRAFAELRLQRLHATVDAGNAASRRVLERSGFGEVGRLSRPSRPGEAAATRLLYQYQLHSPLGVAAAYRHPTGSARDGESGEPASSQPAPGAA